MWQAVVAVIVLVLLQGTAWAETRVALIIGNSKYSSGSELRNPTNDASDLADLLEKMNFKVIRGLDLSKSAMENKLIEFSTALWGADTALFFYAGHGIETDGEIQLVPTDAPLTAPKEPSYSLISLGAIQRTMTRYSSKSILLIDACRLPGKNRGNETRGLVRAPDHTETLISFATAPSSPANDGDGRNSPYTDALLKTLSSSNEDLASILMRVRKMVLASTKGEQITWDHSSLTERVYLSSSSIETSSVTKEQSHQVAKTEQTPQIAMLAPDNVVVSPDREIRHVATGAESLRDSDFAILRNKRIGLITNQSAMVGGEHIVDVLDRTKHVQLVRILVPEHGFLGRTEAGAKVKSTVDKATGIPVLSLYGTTRKPLPEMLEGLDALVFDIQDVGVRFYTYISTLGYAMQAAAEARIPLIVLDRPNPLGGEYVSGFVMEDAYRSFIGLYPLPIAHGLTVGEIAGMIQKENLLPGLSNLVLTVVPMKGWSRSMRWQQISDRWVPTSPALRKLDSVMVYPGTALFEGTTLSYGRGTEYPFRQVGAPWIDGQTLAKELQAMHIPGLAVEPVYFIPESLRGINEQPAYLNTKLPGVRLSVTDANVFQPVEAGIKILVAVNSHAQSRQKEIFGNTIHFSKLAGTSRLLSQIKNGVTADAIIASWRAEVEKFKRKRQPYLLYN